MDWIFGYGSLINAKSRRKTWEECDVRSLPVRIRGFKREWTVHGHYRKYTALGCSQISGNTCNGVIIRLEEDGGIEAFDKREYGYKRVRVDPSVIEFPFDHDLQHWKAEILDDKKSTVWVYLNEQVDYPTIEFPLAQTYIDIVIAGCLDHGKAFALEFVTTTWNKQEEEVLPWIDDREPARLRRYIRADNSFDLPLNEIDDILKQSVPNSLACRVPGDTQLDETVIYNEH